MIVWRGRLGHFLIPLLFFNEYEIQMQSEKHSKVIERQPKKSAQIQSTICGMVRYNALHFTMHNVHIMYRNPYLYCRVWWSENSENGK